MPNWCNNNITITGPKDKIKKLWEDSHWTETYTEEDGTEKTVNCFGLLNTMHPMPKELEGTTSPSDADNWYDWRISNWSTKWDITDEGLEYEELGDDASITGWFESAWAPPIGVYEHYLNENDDVSIDAWYHEPGMDFGGHFDNGDDQYMEGLSDCARKAIKTGNSGDSLYDELDEYYDLTEQMREWVEEEEVDEEEEARRDEKHGLYPDREDISN